MVTAIDPPGDPEFAPVNSNTNNAGEIKIFVFFVSKRIVFV